MAQCHRHHPHQYYRDECEPVEAAAYSDTTYATDGMRSFSENRTFVVEEPPRDYVREEKQYKNRERLGEVGAVAAGAFALYEGNKAKKEPENARKHKIEEGLAAAAAVGAGGYAFYEHHERKEAKDDQAKCQQYY